MIDWIIALREIKKQITEKRKKDALLNTLVGQELNYTIIKDLINSARYDVIIDLTLKDGTNLKIKRMDSFDKILDKHDPEQRY